MNRAREDALNIFQYALDASRVDVAMARRVRFDDGALQIDGHTYLLAQYHRLVLIAFGKAGDTMARAFLRQVGSEADRFEGVVVAPEGMESPLPGLRVYGGGHPSPNAASVAAAMDILETLQSLTEHDLVIFLVSGGGSAMVELFLQPGISLDVMVATHKALVGSGAPIAAMNAVRKHLSAVKGGRLAAAAPAEQMTIFVSDVPEGELDALSSGPTLPDRSTTEDVYRIAEEYGLVASLPGQVSELLRGRTLVETPKPGDKIFARSRWSVLLDSGSLAEAAGVRARELGWNVEVDNRCDDWSTERASDYLLGRVRELRRGGGGLTCLLSVGEVTVQVPLGAAGKGGRNQHFALLCSERIAGNEIMVLSAGSDGIDGNSPAAGALVDGLTMKRAEAVGYPVVAALAAFDSYSLLDALGDTIMTGPTGNNLRDLRILLAP